MEKKENIPPHIDEMEAIKELRGALSLMLSIFDRGLPPGSIGQETCANAREILSKYKPEKP